VNVFWGLNGTGKTSLLKILNSALTNQIGILRRVPFERAEVVFWSGDGQVKIKRTIVHESIDFEESADPFDDSEPHLESVGEGLWREVQPTPRVRLWTSEIIEGDFPEVVRQGTGRTRRHNINAGFRHSYLPISRLTQVQRNSLAARRGAVVDDAFLDEDFADQVRTRWQSYNADALARIRSIQQQGLASILALLFGGGLGTNQPINQSVSVPGEEAYEVVREFLSQQGISLKAGRDGFLTRYEQQPELPAVVDAIDEVTREAELALRPQKEFQETVERLYTGGKILRLDPSHLLRGSLRVEIDGTNIPLQSLSSGEKQLLRLMLETLAAGSSTVMIDEPELSMHVDWQQVLVAAMRRVNPECQMLLATHSPEVMAEVADENVFEL